jgi:hypothetical protein
MAETLGDSTAWYLKFTTKGGKTGCRQFQIGVTDPNACDSKI